MSVGRQSPYQRYLSERRRKCKMKPRLLMLVKGFLFSAIMGIVVSISIVEGQGEITVVAFIVAVLLVFGIEINEIEVGNALYIDFTNISKQNDPDDSNDDGPE